MIHSSLDILIKRTASRISRLPPTLPAIIEKKRAEIVGLHANKFFNHLDRKLADQEGTTLWWGKTQVDDPRIGFEGKLFYAVLLRRTFYSNFISRYVPLESLDSNLPIQAFEQEYSTFRWEFPNSRIIVRNSLRAHDTNTLESLERCSIFERIHPKALTSIHV